MLPVMSLEVLVAELRQRNNISQQSRLSRTAVMSIHLFVVPYYTSRLYAQACLIAQGRFSGKRMDSD